MSATPDSGPSRNDPRHRIDLNPDPTSMPNWRVAVMDLIASRISLIQLEAKDLVGRVVIRVAMLAAALLCTFFTWALLLAGLVAIVADAGHWPWKWVAIVAALLHLIGAVVLALLAKGTGHPAFPVTRSEFQKDRSWIENFQQTRK